MAVCKAAFEVLCVLAPFSHETLFLPERCLEDHELVAQVDSTMAGESKFLFRKNYGKYEFFKNPTVSPVSSARGGTRGPAVGTGISEERSGASLGLGAAGSGPGLLCNEAPSLRAHALPRRDSARAAGRGSAFSTGRGIRGAGSGLGAERSETQQNKSLRPKVADVTLCLSVGGRAGKLMSRRAD